MAACQAAPANPSTPVILISVDTLRADHLSCYQPGRAPTPHIDGLAKGGTLYSQASTPFPLTLPAHAALLTSTYPFANGVEDNGVPLPASAVTLAAVLKNAGYRTAAFVGSFVLDRRFGLSPGFDVYEGPIDLQKAAGGNVERKRPGAQVAQAAMRWVEKNSGGPFFLFLHLYDLHLPYELPRNPALRHGETGYTAELAYEDGVLGEFFAFLARRGVLDKALIVFTSDHGEGLGDHGESTHGYFIYQSTVHVPLLIHWPSGFGRTPGGRVEEPASLLDVAPTILDAIGLRPAPGMKGRSLIGAGSGDVYTESLYARKHFGCAALRSVRVGSYKYISAPKPELYDLASDPRELKNVYDQQRSRVAALAARIAAVRAASPAAASGKPASPRPDSVEALRSLGYLAGPERSGGVEPRIDPKDRIGDFERYYRALDLASAGKLAESDALLRSLSGKLPDLVDIRISMGLNRQRLGDYGQAASDFQQAIKLAPSDAQSHFELGSCYFRMGKSGEALRQFTAALALEPWYTRADEALAEIYLQKQDYARAREHLDHLLSVDPASYTAHFNLGIFAAMEKDWTQAEQHMLAALQTDPESADAHSMLGNIYLQLNDLERARRQFADAVRLKPDLAQAHYSLGVILQQQGKHEEAAREFRAAQQAGGSGGPAPPER